MHRASRVVVCFWPRRVGSYRGTAGRAANVAQRQPLGPAAESDGTMRQQLGESASKWPGRTPAIASRVMKSLAYAAPLKSCPRIGSERRRLPVAAKIAFVTAGWIMVAPGSPTPPHRLPAVGEM